MVIYMDQYRTAKAAPVAWLKNGTYGEEVMRASWNPAVVQMIREATPLTPSPELPDELSGLDTEEFLGRVYGLASLI